MGNLCNSKESAPIVRKEVKVEQIKSSQAPEPVKVQVKAEVKEAPKAAAAAAPAKVAMDVGALGRDAEESGTSDSEHEAQEQSF